MKPAWLTVQKSQPITWAHLTQINHHSDWNHNMSTSKPRKYGWKCPPCAAFQAELLAGGGKGLEQMVRVVPVQVSGVSLWQTNILFTRQSLPSPCSRNHFRSQKPGCESCNWTSGGILSLSTSPLEIVHTWNIPHPSLKTVVSVCKREKRSVTRGCPFLGQKEKESNCLKLRSRTKHWSLVLFIQQGQELVLMLSTKVRPRSSSALLWPHAAFLCLLSACSGNSANRNSPLTVWVAF